MRFLQFTTRVTPKTRGMFRCFSSSHTNQASSGFKEIMETSLKQVIKRQGSHLGYAKIFSDTSLRDAAQFMIESHSSCLIVLNRSDSSVSGLISESDVVAIGLETTSSSDEKTSSSESFWDLPVEKAMIPRSKLVLMNPNDSVWSAIQFLTEGSKRLPVVENSNLTGLLSVRDILRFLYRELEYGNSSGKANYLENVVSRKGMPANIVVDQKAHAESIECQLVGVNFGHSSIPHPKKKDSGGEDAWMFYESPPGKNFKRDGFMAVMGVCDGVGTWSFEKGIDPSIFSRNLAKYAEEAATEAIGQMKLDESENSLEYNSVSPFRLLNAAWNRLQRTQVYGSSTACILVVDGVSSEVHAANLGDSGFLILRHSKPRFAGSIDLQRDQQQSSEDYALHVLYRSPQQLHYFNCPYQLGISPSDEEKFDQPNDCNRVRIPVVTEDIIILATDGLFDNLGEEDILRICSDHWEYGLDSNEKLQKLASDLSTRAHYMSLLKDVDSPFAILAKENDIMWGGGMPDDITVLVAKVFEKNE